MTGRHMIAATQATPRGRRPVRPGDRTEHGQQVDDEHADRDDRHDQVMGRIGHDGSLMSALDTQTVPFRCAAHTAGLADVQRPVRATVKQ